MIYKNLKNKTKIKYQGKLQQIRQLFQSDHQQAKQLLTRLCSVLTKQMKGTCWFPFPDGVLFPLLLPVDHLIEIERGQQMEYHRNSEPKMISFLKHYGMD